MNIAEYATRYDFKPTKPKLRPNPPIQYRPPLLSKLLAQSKQRAVPDIMQVSSSSLQALAERSFIPMPMTEMAGFEPGMLFLSSDIGKLKVATWNDMLEKARTFIEEHYEDEIHLGEMDMVEMSNQNDAQNPDQQDVWMRVQNPAGHNVDFELNLPNEDTVEVDNSYWYTDHDFYTNEEV